MTIIKKLKDYTVSDIEYLLKEKLTEDERIHAWNDYCYDNTIHTPDIIDTLLDGKRPTEILSFLSDDFNINDKYCTLTDDYLFVTFNHLDDDKSPLDYKQCALYILEDETNLVDFFNSFGFTWLDD